MASTATRQHGIRGAASPAAVRRQYPSRIEAPLQLVIVNQRQSDDSSPASHDGRRLSAAEPRGGLDAAHRDQSV